VRSGSVQVAWQASVPERHSRRIGETQAWRRQGSAETLTGLVSVIKKSFEPMLIGRNACDIAAIMHDLEERMYHTQYAQAAIGDALYDIMSPSTSRRRSSRCRFGTSRAWRRWRAPYRCR